MYHFSSLCNADNQDKNPGGAVWVEWRKQKYEGRQKNETEKINEKTK